MKPTYDISHIVINGGRAYVKTEDELQKALKELGEDYFYWVSGYQVCQTRYSTMVKLLDEIRNSPVFFACDKEKDIYYGVDTKPIENHTYYEFKWNYGDEIPLRLRCKKFNY